MGFEDADILGFSSMASYVLIRLRIMFSFVLMVLVMFGVCLLVDCGDCEVKNNGRAF